MIIQKTELNQLIEDGTQIDVGYRMRQCNVADIAKSVTSFDWRLGVRTAPEKPKFRSFLLKNNQYLRDNMVIFYI